MKKRVFEILANRGISVGHCVDFGRVRDLMQRMRPQHTVPLIRLGADFDGGYLVPDDLAGLGACFSPGVDCVASFECALAARGIPCYLADGSVDGPPVSDPLLHFDRKFLGVVEDELTVTMDRWVNDRAPDGNDLILQMDIEGAEWPVLLNMSDETMNRFRIIVVELHFLEHLVDATGFSLMYPALDRLLRSYQVVHLHPNNLAQPVIVADFALPRLLEVTLHRRDRAVPTGFVSQFPHPLDRPNLPHRPDPGLPRCWYQPEAPELT